jgi:hypothetical protein
VLDLYTAVAYPDIPRELGGGRRPSIEVLLLDVPAIDWAAAGLDFSEKRKKIGPVTLLLDTPASLTVIRPETWKERRFSRAATNARNTTAMPMARVREPREKNYSGSWAMAHGHNRPVREVG